MARKAFPKRTLRGVSVNIRDLPKYLHLQMRVLAIEQNVSLGRLYGEAVRAYLASQDDPQKKVA